MSATASGSGVGLGLVLGAGGAVGWAYHLGVVEGMREAVGCEPTDAERIIGTSAGGAIAASLLTGADTATILGSVRRPMAPEDTERMQEARRSLFRRHPRTLLPQAPKLLGKGGLIGLVGLLPAGMFPTFPLRRFPASGLEEWPPSLWMPAVRLDDGEVVVFGRDRNDLPVIDALEATSAVPGMFRPKEINGARYIDGAVGSATHADLLLGQGISTALVSSPMTRPGGGPIKRRARRQLRQELGRLNRAGIRTVVVEPDEEIMAVAEGFPRQNPEAGPAVVAAARAQTIEAFAALPG